MEGGASESQLEGALLAIYASLNGHFGDLAWWPAETPLEVIVGAILTQNTAWTNVEKAIARLKERGLITPFALMEIPVDELARIIRPAGYYRLKARRIKSFLDFLAGYQGRLEAMFSEDTRHLRLKLLQVNGIGEETADSILLYAGGKKIFVVDAYTRRIGARHGLLPPEASYGTIQRLFMENLPEDLYLYRQFHALLVNTGKYFCRKTPLCQACPLAALRCFT